MVIQSFKQWPLPARAGNALISYAVYLWQMVWPAKLAVFYPYVDNVLSPGEIVLALVIFASISATVSVWRRKHPYLLVGWLWYVGMLVPVIGLVQIGEQAHADRYTYLPQIGLTLALTWAAGSLGTGWRHRRLFFGGAAMTVLAALGVASFKQTTYWRDSETLWTHAIACAPENAVAQSALGIICFQKGQLDEAIVHFQKAVDIRPDYAMAHLSLGGLLAQKGRLDEAIAHFQKVVDLQPDNIQVRIIYGDTLLDKRRLDETIVQYQRALQLAVAKHEDQLADRLRVQISRCQSAISAHAASQPGQK